MKEKKKKRKFWMNRIVAFVTTVCMACVTFVVPAFAEETSGSSFTVYDGYSVSDGTYSHEFGADFSTDDVVVFVIEYDTTSEDTYGNVNRGVTYLFTSSSPFSGTWHFSRKANHADWSEYDDGTISVDSFNDNYGCYNYWPNGEYWPTTVNPSFIGKYIRMRVPSSISPMDYGQFVKKYYLGEDISDYVVESDLTGQLDTDIDSIGYLKDVKVNVLGVEGKEYFAITYGSLTTSDYDLANSNIQYQLRSRYYTSAGLCDLDTITDIETLPANSYKVTFDKEELNAPIQQCIFDNIIYPVAGNDEPNFFEDRAIFQVLHSSDAFSYVEIYMRPTGFVNNQECVGGWTKIHIELAQDGSYTTDSYLISEGTNDSYQIIAGLDDEWNDVTPPSKNNPDYGTGSTIDSALNNIPSVDNAFSFDLSSVDDLGSYFENLLKSLLQSIGTVPTMIKTCFSFLPNEIILFLGGGLVLIVILRIFGR